MILKSLSTLASRLYRVGLSIDKWLKSRRAVRLPCLVVSVGNMTVGGTGKTPLLIRLAQDFLEHQIRPAILTRGYRGAFRFSTRPHIVSSDGSPPPNLKFNDEVSLMVEKLETVPIGVGSNRGAVAHKILGEHSVDLVLLDDGFQHWALHRDWDIVCIDSTDPWGGESLLPQGRLREPLSSLERANVVVMTRCELSTQGYLQELESEIRQRAPRALVLKSKFESHMINAHTDEIINSDLYTGKKLIVLSAIGNPSSFELAVIKRQIKIIPVRYTDHHEYTDKELLRVERIAKEEKTPIITTEKDWMKLKSTRWAEPDAVPFGLFVLKVSLVFLESDEDRWIQSLEPFMKKRVS